MSITQSHYEQMRARLSKRNVRLTDEPPFEGKESELHRLIIDHCRNRQWLCFHGAMHKRAMRPAGEPDFQIYGDKGRFWLIEAKTSTGKLRPEQIGVMMLAEKLGHIVHVARSYKDFLNIVDKP